MKYAKGIMWLDDCRIPFVDEIILLKGYTGDKWKSGKLKEVRVEDKINSQGRFTPNLLVCDNMLNDGTITKQNTRTYTENTCGGGIFPIKSNGRTSTGDIGTNSRYYDLDKWFDKLIDEIN